MSIFRKLKRALRGEVSLPTALWETVRRSNAAMRERRERGNLAEHGKKSARLTPGFAGLSAAVLLEHFQQRNDPHFFPGFDPSQATDASSSILLRDDALAVFASADQITNEHCWPLFGNANHQFIDWHRDPFSGYEWPLDFYGDIKLQRNDGSDVRAVWELNRLGHLLTLARAYSLNGDRRFSAEFFRQVESWDSRNPVGYGVNWSCAMEVALRAINLLGALAVFRRATDFDSEKLARLLRIFDQHGRFIREHLEFSYIATSNHYLSNLAGLLWLGIMLPELEDGAAWRVFGLRELQREMDKQVLPDGADYESSTGYHRFVVELFCYSFLLCRLNGIEIEEPYWQKLQRMFEYVRAYLRPDGYAPLLGDTDSGQVFPLSHHRGDDHGYLLAIGAVLFDEAQLKDDKLPIPAELPWLFGEEGVAKYRTLKGETGATSKQFPDAGVYILRDADLYLLFNASSAGVNGRGSHGHNDALSVEVSACGRAFIVDPGSYVYTADLHERHLFRSTAYHSTVEIDATEQNTTNEQSPFVIGNEARPQVLLWETGAEVDRVIAEHFGYGCLPQPVTHRRTIIFNKRQCWWLVEDEFQGSGEHSFAVRFHLNAGLDLSWASKASVWASDKLGRAKLLIGSLDLEQTPALESQFTSTNYHDKSASITACWQFRTQVPCRFRWILIPVGCTNGDADFDLARRLEQAETFLATQIS